MLRNRFRGLPDRRIRSIILNLAGLQLMDSLGLGELVAAKRAAQAVGGRVTLLNVGMEVGRTLEMARLLGEFEVYDDERSTVASFQRWVTLSSAAITE